MKMSAIVQDVTIRAHSEGVDAAAAATDRLAQAGDKVVASASRQERAALSIDRAYERLQRQIDASYRQTQAFEQGQRVLDRALQQNRISTEAYERSIGLLQTRYAQAGGAVNDNVATISRFEKATGLAGHQVQNLGFQLNDVAVSLASGQSPFTVLVQQGAQILPILSAAPGGIGGALAGIGRYLVGLVTPASAAAAALLAIGVGGVAGMMRLSAETEMLEKALTGVGRSTQTTAAGLARMAEAAATQAKLSTSAAKETAAALASTGQIGIANFEDLIAISKRFADALGLDAAEANKKLADSFSDPLKGADDLNGKLNFLSDATRSYIRELQAQNDQTGAQRALLDALSPALANATANTTLLGRAWAYVASAAAGAAAAIANALKGPTPEQALQSARSRLEGISTGGMSRTPLGQTRIKDAQNDLMVLEEQYRRNGQAAAAASKAMADEATANKISVQAGDITRALNPLAVKYDELRNKAAVLKEALDKPSKLSDVKATQEAYDSYSRAVSTLTDTNGRLISSTDLLRQKDELAVAAKKATTDAEKATIAERQKSIDLVGELITKEEAARRVSHAGAMERIKDAKAGGGGGSGSASDAFDNAIQRSKDQIEELKLQAEQASKTTAEVYRLTEAHKLRRAALSAGRGDEAGITDLINAQAEAYAKQRVATDQAIEAQRRYQESVRYTGDLISSFVEDVLTGKLDAALKSLGKSFLSASVDALISGKGPLAGISGLAPADKNGQGGLIGMLTSLPKAVEKGAKAGTVDGVVNGMGTFAANDNFGLSALGIDGKQLAGGLTAIAGLAGAYGAGMSAGSIGQAAGGGAISGLMGGAGLATALGMTGSMLLPGIGLIIGAGLAVAGNMAAKEAAKKQREEQAQENYRQAAPGIETLRSQLRGESQDTLENRIKATMAEVQKGIDVAFFAKKIDEANALGRDFGTYKDKSITDFQRALPGLIDSLNKGFGPNSAFASAREQVKQTGEALKGLVSDTVYAFGADSPWVQEARDAARSQALAILDGAKSLSTVQQRMEEVRGAGSALQTILVELGMSASDAAAAIEQDTIAALARLASAFQNDINSAINDAQGYSYVNDFNALFADVAQKMADAAALGLTNSNIDEYFRAKAQEIVDGAQLTGSAFDHLIAGFPQLAGVITEFTNGLKGAAREADIAARRLNAQDRLFGAANDNSTLEGQLAAYNRAAMREREAEIKAGGEALVELEQAQAAERYNIIRDWNQKIVDDQKRAADEASAFWDRFSKQIKEYTDGLRAGSDSPLSPQARLAAAQSQYAAQLSLAQGGDRDALSGITSYSSDLLDAAKAYYASSTGYQDIFASVIAQLEALPDQVSETQLIIDAIDAGAQATVDMLAIMKSSLEVAVNSGSAQQIAAALSTYFNKIDTNTSASIDFAEMQSALGGMASNSQLYSMFTRLDTDASGSLSKLELIKASTDGTTSAVNYQQQILDLIRASTSSTNANAQSIANASEILKTNTYNDWQIGERQHTSFGAMIDLMGLIRSNVSSANNRFYAQGNSAPVAAYAAGGYVSGAGTSTSDSISARLSDGEYVMRAAAVDRFGVGMLDQMNDNFRMPAVAMPVTAGGGGQSNAALIAEIKALRAEVKALREDTRKGAVLVGEEVASVNASVRAGNAVTEDSNKLLLRKRA